MEEKINKTIELLKQPNGTFISTIQRIVEVGYIEAINIINKIGETHFIVFEDSKYKIIDSKE